MVIDCSGSLWISNYKQIIQQANYLITNRITLLQIILQQLCNRILQHTAGLF